MAASRRFFNNATSEYNTSIQQFPANILAKMFSFKEAEYFEVQEGDRSSLEKPAAIEF